MKAPYRQVVVASILVLGLLIVGSIQPANADPQDDGDSGSSGISQTLSKLTVHGFLTQAYATASFSEGGFFSPTDDERILGIPEDGTFDYRAMALQFRYEISTKDIVIVQFSSRSLGDSPIEEVEDEIELDWAFYERRIGDDTSIKIGRVQIPFGIFNELRDVGTVLPFYRPAFTFYREGSFTSETVDGVVFSHTFAAQSEWSLDFDAYLGTWDLVESPSLGQGETSLATADGFGVSLWLNTPVYGLRLGAGYQQRDVSGGLEGLFRPVGGEDTFDDFWASFDYAGDRFVARAEYRTFEADPDEVFAGGEFPLWYGQLGYHPNEKLRIYVQAEFSDAKQPKEDFFQPVFGGLPITEDVDIRFREDIAASLSYLFSSNLVLKLEHHFDVTTEQLGIVPVFAPPFPFPIGLRPVTAVSDGGEYTILSFSVSF